MIDYYIRCKRSKRDVLLALAVELGVLVSTPQGHLPASNNEAWYEIGELMENDQVVCSPDGEPYWHANLRTTYDLWERANSVYEARPTPELAYGLSHIGEFYVSAEGRAASPASPAVVFL